MRQTGVFYVVYSHENAGFLMSDMTWTKTIDDAMHIGTVQQAADYVESSDEVVLPVSFSYVVQQ